jgi:hypothetical protein
MNMTPFPHRLVALVVIGVAAIGGRPSTVHAQEQVALDLVLRKTYMKTDDTTFTPPYSFGVFPVFTPTTVSCPNGGTCTVRVEVSAEMSVTSGTIYGRVYVDQQEVQGAVALISTLPSQHQRGAHTHTWMVGGLAPGDHTIDVNFWFPGVESVTWVSQRTLTISVYKP